MKRKSQRKHSLFVVIILMCICLFIYFVFPLPPCALSSFDKRAIWVSYKDLEKLSFESKEDFCKDYLEILENVQKYEVNTMIVHVRAFADALYYSKLFPISQVVSKKTDLSFDPLEVMVELTHEKGMNFEAWINPYRISLNYKTLHQFLDNSPKKSWLDKNQTIKISDYEYIFNPASQDVRDYIVSGIQEIVENYEVDGIHFDDYFYIEGSHGITSQNQRLDYVNMLIQDVYQSIKVINKDVVFGISPQGNYENCINAGADVETWLKEEGFVDYVMPQIYWSHQYGEDGKTKLFYKRAKLFRNLASRDGVKLYAGLALYRAGEDIPLDLGWKRSSQNISDQVQDLYELGYDGYCFFDYSSLLKSAGQKELQTLLKNHPKSH